MTRKKVTKPPAIPEFGKFIDRPFTTKEDRAAAAALPIPERVEIVNRLSASTPHYKQVQKALKGFHRPVENAGHDVGKIYGLIGPSRTGKSWALGNYIQGLGMMDRTDAVVPRAVYIEASEGGTGREFGGRFYELMGLGDAPRRAAEWLLREVREEVVQYGIELVVVDDAQFILSNRIGGTDKAFKSFLKQLSDAQTCNIVLAGDQTVEDVIRSVPHLEGRGGFPIERVKRYAWSSDGTTGDFGKLLDRIDNRLPFLLPSNISEPATAAHLYKLSEGIIGLVMNIVKAAALAAIEDGASNVGVDHLRAAARRTRRPDDPYQPFDTPLPSPTRPNGGAGAAGPANQDEPTFTRRRRPRRAA